MAETDIDIALIQMVSLSELYLEVYMGFCCLSEFEDGCIKAHGWLIVFFMFNATFSNISAISWRPVLVVEEAGVPR